MPKASPTNPFALDEDTMPYTRRAAALCYSRCILATIDGDFDEAWRTWAIIAAGSRTRMTASGSLIFYLTNSGIDGIAHNLAAKISAGDPDAARVKKAGEQFDKLRPDAQDLSRAYAGELRLFQSALPHMREILRGSQTTVENLETNLVERLGGTKPEPPPLWKRRGKAVATRTSLEWSLLNTLPNASMTEYARRLEPLMNSPETLLPEKSVESVAFYDRNYGGRSLVTMVTGGFRMIQCQHLAQVASHRLTRLALALRVYQLSHDGKYPPTLDAVTTGFAPEDLTDPFDGKPLRYDAKTGKVRSIGKDFKDDGGRLDEYGESKDIVVAPPVLTPVAEPTR